jgi:MoaA/NifB/PqqE/SkfB family radical SAM enzyme
MDLFTQMDQRKLPDIKITLRTNGMALSPRNWNRIKNAHFAIDRILISIDAATPDTYHILRRGGNFEQLIKNLKFVSSIKKRGKIYVGLNFVVQKQNFKEMPDFVIMAKKYKFDGVTFTQLIDRNTYQSKDFEDMAIHHPEHPRFNELKEIMKSPILRDPIVSFANLSHLL